MPISYCICTEYRRNLIYKELRTDIGQRIRNCTKKESLDS